MSGEDHWLEKAEIVLARIAPSAIASVIRRIVKEVGTRTLPALYSLSFRLSRYDLLLDRDARMALQSVHEGNLDLQSAGDDQGSHCELFLFSRVLPLWDGNEQLSRLLARPEAANDWIDFEWSYQGPIPEPLPAVSSARSCRCRFSFTCRTILLITEGLRYS
jgi:hypothetical protein